MKFRVKKIQNYECKDWLLNKHYAKRMCSISYAYGLFDLDNIVQGVCTFGKPASSPLRIGICGEIHESKVYELNRFIINDNEKNIASYFIAKALKMLPNDLIIVSYADTSQGHHGYIYQATNWIYTGLSAKRTDWKIKGLEHLHGATIADMSRGKKDRAKYMRKRFGDDFYLEDRARKHRYIYFTGSKTQKKHLRNALNYTEQGYPKGDNKRYDTSYIPTVQTKLF